MNIENCVIVSNTDLTEIKQMLKQLLSHKEGINVMGEYVPENVAAEILGIKKTTLQVWKSRGKIPFHKPDGNRKGITYYKVSDLMDFQKGVKHHSNKEIEVEANTYLLKNRK